VIWSWALEKNEIDEAVKMSASSGTPTAKAIGLTCVTYQFTGLQHGGHDCGQTITSSKVAENVKRELLLVFFFFIKNRAPRPAERTAAWHAVISELME